MIDMKSISRLRSLPGRHCISPVIVGSETLNHSTNLDVSHPVLVLLVPGNPSASRSIQGRYSFVLTIFLAGCSPKILDPVVACVAILVVNFLGRKLAIDDQPGQTVSGILNTIDSDQDIAKAIRGTSHCPDRYAITLTHQPDKNPCLRIILEALEYGLAIHYAENKLAG